MARDLKAQIVIGGKVAASLAPAFKFAQRECNNLTKTQMVMSKVMQGVRRVAATALIAGITAIGAGIGYVATHSLELASSLNEVQNVVDTTFGQSAGVINAWAKEASTSFGLSELQAKQFSGTMGAMLKSMGLTEGQATKMSMEMSGLAGDLASFFNLDIEDSFDKIRSGISGETEPLKQLGINLSEANLKAFAFAQGISKDYSKLDEASKAAVRYAYLMSVTKDAQGDFAKTSESFANQQRILKNNLDSTFAEFGQQLLPIANQGLQMLNQQLTGGGLANLFSSLAPLVEKLLPVFAQLLDYVAGSVAPALLQILTQLLDQVILPILPTVMELAQAVLPVLVTVLGVIIDLFAQLVPVIKMIMPVITMLLPIISLLANLFGGVLGSIIQALMPVIEVLCDLLVTVLGPIFEALSPILEVVADILGVIAGVIGDVLLKAIEYIRPALEWLVGILTDVIGFVGDVINGIGSIFTGGNSSVDIPGGNNISLPKYADGGFADRPSIFGDDGLEAAIPLRRTPRSLGLLNRTAQALGAGGGVSITYAPVISGASKEEIQQALDEDKPRFRNLVESVFDEEARVSYA